MHIYCKHQIYNGRTNQKQIRQQFFKKPNCSKKNHKGPHFANVIQKAWKTNQGKQSGKTSPPGRKASKIRFYIFVDGLSCVTESSVTMKKN